MLHHLIFEGAELSGKSWVMSEVYNKLEPKYNQSGYILDGCHWFNCDLGFYGTDYGKKAIKNYLRIFNDLKDRNLLVEKLFLSDIVYNRLHRHKKIHYGLEEKKLLALDFKIILVTFPENEELLEQRLADRLNLYPHYQRIAKEPAWYIKQQREYLREVKKTKLPYLILPAENLPDNNLPDKILEWIGE
jgi:hypothetical protein